MIIKESKRVGQVQEYYFSKKLKQIDQLRAEGHNVINLGIGSPDMSPSDNTIQTLYQESLKDKCHGYQSYIGSPVLRKAFAQWYKKSYQVELNPDNEILPLIGSKEGIMHISMAFLDEGDEVLVPNPGYPTYSSATKLAGGVVRDYDLLESNGYMPDFEALNKQDLSKVKIMWVNYPHMPSGTNGNQELFKQLIDFGLKHKILICHDNPYSFILNDSPQSILSVPNAMEVALELNSLSKSHNMAGWRIGMIGGDKSLLKSVLQFKSNMDSGMYLPMQLAAVEALKSGEDWFQNINKVYRQRRLLAEKIFKTINCTYLDSQVGMFLWGKVPDNIKNSETLSDEILDKTKVFITPGIIFGSNGDRYIRLSLCSDETLLNEALTRIDLLM